MHLRNGLYAAKLEGQPVLAITGHTCHVAHLTSPKDIQDWSEDGATRFGHNVSQLPSGR